MPGARCPRPRPGGQALPEPCSDRNRGYQRHRRAVLAGATGSPPGTAGTPRARPRSAATPAATATSSPAAPPARTPWGNSTARGSTRDTVRTHLRSDDSTGSAAARELSGRRLLLDIAGRQWNEGLKTGSTSPRSCPLGSQECHLQAVRFLVRRLLCLYAPAATGATNRPRPAAASRRCGCWKPRWCFHRSPTDRPGKRCGQGRPRATGPAPEAGLPPGSV